MAKQYQTNECKIEHCQIGVRWQATTLEIRTYPRIASEMLSGQPCLLRLPCPTIGGCSCQCTCGFSAVSDVGVGSTSATFGSFGVGSASATFGSDGRGGSRGAGEAGVGAGGGGGGVSGLAGWLERGVNATCAGLAGSGVGTAGSSRLAGSLGACGVGTGVSSLGAARSTYRVRHHSNYLKHVDQLSAQHGHALVLT